MRTRLQYIQIRKMSPRREQVVNLSPGRTVGKTDVQDNFLNYLLCLADITAELTGKEESLLN